MGRHARRFVHRCGLLVTALWLLACQGQERPQAHQPCRFLDEVEVAQTGQLALDGLALAVDGGEDPAEAGAVALWSDPAGLHARRLAADGAPVGGVVDLGARCRGGVALTASKAGFEAFCLRTGAQGGDGSALLQVSMDRRLGARGTRQLAAVGSLSEGVSVARGQGKLWVAFHDASPEGQRARIVRMADTSAGTGKAALRELSRAGRAAGPPMAAFVAGQIQATWAETFLDGEQPRAFLMRAVGAGPAVELLEVLPRAPRPQLFSAFGRTYLAYRDRPHGDRSAGLFAVPLSDTGPIGEPVRLGRADGKAVPSLSDCEGGLLASIPRVYAGDYFVGVSRLDARLSRLMPEQQFYEDARAFYQVAAACVGGRPLLLVGERAEPGQSPAALRAVPFSCRR